MLRHSLLLALAVSLAGCGAPGADWPPKPGQSVYLDYGSKEVFVCPENPAVKKADARTNGMVVPAGTRAIFLGVDGIEYRVKLESGPVVWVLSAWVKPVPK